jgi:flagellar biosynthesis protein FlhF
VLIDTAGRSPRDELQIRELQAIVAEAHADEVCLVLSTASGSRTLEHIARQFAPVGITSLILTKLDEATSPGVVLSVARQIPYPVTYLTMGQDVPEDLEPAQSARLARWILGEAELHTLARAA